MSFAYFFRPLACLWTTRVKHASLTTLLTRGLYKSVFVCMCVCVFVCRLICVCVYVHRCLYTSAYMDQYMHAMHVHFLDFLSFFLERSSHHAFFHSTVECSRVCSDRFFHIGALNLFINVLQLMPWVSPRVMYIDWCCIILHVETICSWLFVCFVCSCFYVWLHAVISYNGMNKVFCVLCVQVKGVVPWDWHSQQQGDVWRLHWQDATHLWSQQQKGRHLSVGEKEKKGWGVGGWVGGGGQKSIWMQLYVILKEWMSVFCVLQ